MTIDEAISHAREVAECQKMSARLIEDNAYIPESVDKEAITYGNTICAKEHEQLAEWLEELKQYRTIGTPEELKAAMKYVYLAKKHGTVGQVIENCVKYEEIGTPEECRKSVEICKSMIERNITPEDMEEYMKFEDECISEGFTLKSLLEAGEKQKAKRPDYEGDGYSDGHLVYDTWICPCCGKHYEVDYDDYDFCPACGQCIDWSDEE